jgi:hypothetical protein
VQPLARDGLSSEAVRLHLTADSVEISAGLDLLDSSNTFVEDISDDLVGGSVKRENYTTVHGTCQLQITRELVWGKDRVRPWMTVTANGVTTRWNLGVYVLATPVDKRGESPQTWDVTGYDLLHLLQDAPGDTYVATAGTTYLQAVRDVVTAAGVGATVRLDGSGQDKALPKDRVWALPAEPTWLRIINDLLREIGYDGLWANQDGELRSAPFRPLEDRPVEWTHDTSDDRTNIVSPDRTVTVDVWAAYNWWRFVQRRGSEDPKPVDGDGIYEPSVNATDPAQTLAGRIRRRPVEYLDAPDHASLVAQGDRVVAEDRQVTRRWSGTIDPLPAQWHRDCVRVIDGGTSEKLIASSWTLNLDGSPGEVVFGGDKSKAPEPVDQQTTATVTQATPLRVVVDGATTASPAKALDGATYALGERPTVIVRNPRQPLVQGKEA